jgi:hypothetical protein
VGERLGADGFNELPASQRSANHPVWFGAATFDERVGLG